MNQYRSKEKLKTTSINAAAALMSLGVPLCQHRPITIFVSEVNFATVSFSLCTLSIDGKLKTSDLLAQWHGGQVVNSNLADIKKFFQSCFKAKAVSDKEKLELLHQQTSGGLRGVRKLADIGNFVEANKHLPIAYKLAFIANFSYLLSEIREAPRTLTMTDKRGKSMGVCAIDENLSKIKKQAIISHYEN